jgi:hypothetical protein
VWCRRERSERRAARRSADRLRVLDRLLMLHAGVILDRGDAAYAWGALNAGMVFEVDDVSDPGTRAAG